MTNGIKSNLVMAVGHDKWYHKQLSNNVGFDEDVRIFFGDNSIIVRGGIWIDDVFVINTRKYKWDIRFLVNIRNLSERYCDTLDYVD